MAHGVANEFGLILQAESLHEGGAVILHRPLADVEPRSNLRIRLPLRRQLQHLTLSRRESLMRIECACFGLFNVGIDSDLRDRRTEETSSRGRLSHSSDQILLGAVFEDISNRTVL